MAEERQDGTNDAEEALGFPVVAIGASAGGLEAVKEMLSAAPKDCGLAFVLIQHLDPHHESLMAELVGRSTSLTVKQINDGDQVEPGCVFVIPPGKKLSIKAGRLQLEPFSAPRGLRRPIDAFFTSLAETQGPNAACVVLSGTGADGSAGLRVIKEMGGVCVAQEPGTARYDGMPSAAIGTGLIDYSLAPEDIVPELSAYFQRRNERPLKGEAAVVASNVDQLCEVLLDTVGHDFSSYKRTTLVRRIERRMQLLDIETAEEYLERVRGDEEECEALFRDLLIHVTAFFRDSAFFDMLRDHAINPLVQSMSLSDEIRVWVPGCSTGEEAYSIAMLFAEASEHRERKPMVQIFATDISEEMLRTAREARYPSSALLDIPERFREKYTIGLDGQFQITPRIRDMVRFSSHSLIKDPPFSRLDMISCRNLLIYMDDKLQGSLVPLMHYALKPGGFLFLGPSESLSRRDDLFVPIDQKARLFKRSERGVSYPIELPLRLKGRRPKPKPNDRPLRQFETGSRSDLFASTVMERYAPASVLLTPDGDLMASFGELSKYFKLSVGNNDQHVSSIARRGVREVLMPLLREVADKGERRALRDVEVTSEFGTQRFDLIADPLPDGTVTVVFIEVERFRQELKDYYSDKGEPDDRVFELEEELRLTRFRLRSTVEELETANEELKSSNEEMMSMNEELQSANEELSTVNEELKNKVDELGVAHDDLKNFLSSTNIALLVVDKELRIRAFTREAIKIFPLVESDRGRPLTDVAPRVGDLNIAAEAREVLRTGKVFEQLAVTQDTSEFYTARIVPYTMTGGSVEGVTMTFSNITALKALEGELRDKNDRLALALTIGRMGIWEYLPETGEVRLDDEEAKLFDLPADGELTLDDIVGRIHEDDRDMVTEALGRAVNEGELYDQQFRVRHEDGSIHHLKGIGRAVDSNLIVGINYDITIEERNKADKELLFREMNHRVKNLFAVISSIVNIAARSAVSTQDLAAGLKGRILALARAHEFTLERERERTQAGLKEMLEVVLGSHKVDHEFTLTGPEVIVPPNLTTPIGMIAHELATNSSKYGALSADDGEVSIAWSHEDGNVILRWQEKGGPVVSEPPARSGFGSLMIDSSASQLSGTLERNWHSEGLEVVLEFPLP
ncbi:chemotaxis protein CheB [Qipengyuania flava]|uniref:chemotaxis protein CheB n=1 Tax=Qipengyuania flava TaxID=192812 RepID=UPI001C63902B|nr:chemotaxis protein CheB [Qipengyuania flava]QYJ06708.1 PAS domain-containing protein [Qipengyuania flava]